MKYFTGNPLKGRRDIKLVMEYPDGKCLYIYNNGMENTTENHSKSLLIMLKDNRVLPITKDKAEEIFGDKLYPRYWIHHTQFNDNTAFIKLEDDFTNFVYRKDGSFIKASCNLNFCQTHYKEISEEQALKLITVNTAQPQNTVKNQGNMKIQKTEKVVIDTHKNVEISKMIQNLALSAGYTWDNDKSIRNIEQSYLTFNNIGFKKIGFLLDKNGVYNDLRVFDAFKELEAVIEFFAPELDKELTVEGKKVIIRRNGSIVWGCTELTKLQVEQVIAARLEILK